MGISQRFTVGFGFALAVLLASQAAPAALFSSVNGTINPADYSLSVNDGVDSGTDFDNSEFDIDTVHFGFEQDDDEGTGILVGFDVFGNASDAVSAGFTTVTLDLFGGTTGDPQVYRFEATYFGSSSSLSLVDIDDGFSDESIADIKTAVDDDFEIGIPQSLVSDIFPETGTTDFGFSLQLDQPSNNDDDVTGSFESVTIPEPASAALLALGGAAIFAGRRSSVSRR